MKILEKIIEIETHYKYWISNYHRKELTTNNVRIIAESICKVIILSKQGESAGTTIILGNNSHIPKPTGRMNRHLGRELTFADLIITLDDLNVFKDFDKIKIQFQLIKKVSNPSSHSKNKAVDKTTFEDLEICKVAINNITKWVFAEFIKKPVPAFIAAEIESLKGTISLLPSTNEKWQQFQLECNDFDTKRYQYILISPLSISTNQHTVRQFVKLPWRLVVDFNHKSDENEEGLLFNFNNIIGQGSKKAFTLNNQIEFDPDFKHYWFLANGLGSVQPTNDYKTWKNQYKKFLGDRLYTAFNQGSRIKPRIVVLLNIPPYYAEDIISEFNRVDEINLNFILCSENETYDAIFEKMDNVKLTKISPEEIAQGIDKYLLPNQQSIDQADILIPHLHNGKRTTLKITRDHFDYLQSLGIELVYKDIEIAQSSDQNNLFYTGSTITWRDLAEQRDISRNTQDGLVKKLQSKLIENRLEEVELVHEAGSGGTTLARRVAFFFSSQYPTIILRKFLHRKTIDGLRVIYDQYTKGSLPLLIILESHEVKNSNLLYRDLANSLKNAVILIVHRGVLHGPLSSKKFILKAQLEGPEILAFENLFQNLAKEPAKERVKKIPQEYSSQPKYVSPVLYALTAFGKDYKGLSNYVEKSLQGTSLEQKKIAGFICLIYYYTQKPVQIELFSSLFHTDRSKTVLLDLLGLENPLLDLLHEESDNEQYFNIWRPRYALLGEEAMMIILGGSVENKNNWKNNLAAWLIDLIKYIKESMPYLDDETHDILSSLFIERPFFDNGVVDKDFTRAINDLPSPADGLAVFGALINSYSDEPHFHSHFARFLYSNKIGIKDYDTAIKHATLSIEKTIGNTGNATLIHTLGMCYREKAENIMHSFESQGLSAEEAEDAVKELTDIACDTFDQCIESDADDIYGYESQIRTILKALDFGLKIHPTIKREFFISDPSNTWYAEKLDTVGLLLEEALYVIEQSKKIANIERISRSEGYIRACEGLFFKTLGQNITAKNKFEDLVKNTPKGYEYMRPHYRRMFIFCLLAHKSSTARDLYQGWTKISENELTQCVKYLNENMFEDANNTQNIRLWLHAVRHLKNPPDIITCLSKLGTWTQIITQNINSLLEGYYYLYVLNCIKAISNGNTFDPTIAQIVKDLREKMKPFIKNEKFCFEWYGTGVGIKKMINHKQLGEFSTDFFIKNKTVLEEVHGRIKSVNSSQQGLITLDCGIEAFFVPNIGGFTERNINNRIKCFIGFRYDQVQAWFVVLLETDRNSIVHNQGKTEINYLIEEDLNEENKTEVDVAKKKDEVYKTDSEKLIGPKIIGKIDLEQLKKKK